MRRARAMRDLGSIRLRDRAVQATAAAFERGDAPPQVTQLIHEEIPVDAWSRLSRSNRRVAPAPRVA